MRGNAAAAVVFPACAGMILVQRLAEIGDIGVPRMRGDDPQLRCTMIDVVWCSPHARG